MLIRRPDDIASSEITPERVYLDRRRFLGKTMTAAAAVAGAYALAPWVLRQQLAGLVPGHLQDDLVPTPHKDVTGYNNFYEFGTGKDDPARNAHTLVTHPWSVSVEGECGKPGDYALEDLLSGITVEDRTYRLRCVEAWSMVIPWQGFSMSQLFAKFEPSSQARFVEFTTLLNAEQMPGQRRRVLVWPYVEGLRMDEAMHPLAIFATGLYGNPLLNQNGAPFRIVVPWKYGFKSIKSIVRIRFTRSQPANTWAISAPNEYGFYANVNPEVDHPRWSQARETRSGKFFKQPTLMFNGYADRVAGLYSGMDLSRYF